VRFYLIICGCCPRSLFGRVALVAALLSYVSAWVVVTSCVLLPPSSSSSSSRPPVPVSTVFILILDSCCCAADTSPTLPFPPLQPQTEEGASTQCPVCLTDIDIGAPCHRLPCAHHYHQECILEWLKTKNSCPVCRRLLVRAELGSGGGHGGGAQEIE
jgi:hypothetical protein